MPLILRIIVGFLLFVILAVAIAVWGVLAVGNVQTSTPTQPTAPADLQGKQTTAPSAGGTVHPAPLPVEGQLKALLDEYRLESERQRTTLTSQMAVFRAEAAQYKAEAEALSRLATILIGLGALYAVALAVAQYVNVVQANQSIKDAIERSKESANSVDRLQAEVVRNYPLMQGLGAALGNIIAELNQLLSDPELIDIEEATDKLASDDHFRIQMVERLLPIYDHFPDKNRDLSEMFRGVGRFCLGSHLVAKSKAKGVSLPQGSPLPPVASSDAKAAKYYLERAVKFDPANFAALNDLGFTLEELGDGTEAKRKYLQSLDASRILWKLPGCRNQPAERLTTLPPHATFFHSLAMNAGNC